MIGKVGRRCPIKKFIILIVGIGILIGSVWVIKSSSQFTSTPKKVTFITTERDPNASPVFFNQKEIKKIDVTSLKTKQTKTFTNTDDLKVFTGSMENAKKGNLLLDEDGADLIDCNMWITFQDGSYQKYFVWIMDNDGKDVIIANQSDLTSVNLAFYHLSEANAKKVDNLLKDII